MANSVFGVSKMKKKFRCRANDYGYSVRKLGSGG